MKYLLDGCSLDAHIKLYKHNSQKDHWKCLYVFMTALYIVVIDVLVVYGCEWNMLSESHYIFYMYIIYEWPKTFYG